MLHTAAQAKEMQAELDALMAQHPDLLRLSNKKMNALVCRLSEVFDEGHRGQDLITKIAA